MAGAPTVCVQHTAQLEGGGAWVEKFTPYGPGGYLGNHTPGILEGSGGPLG